MALKVSKTDWDYSHLVDEKKVDVDGALTAVKERVSGFVEKWKNRSDYLENVEAMKEALDDYEQFRYEGGFSPGEYCYFALRSMVEQDNNDVKAKINKMTEVLTELGNEMNFFNLNISKIPKEKQEMFLSAGELKEYRHYLERSFAVAEHLLSEEEEKIMNLKSESSYSKWVEMVSDLLSREERDVLDSEGKKEKKNFSEILSLLSNVNKKLRDSAADALNDILRSNVDIAEAELNAILFDKKINDKLRKYERPDEAIHIRDDIESEVVDSLVEAVGEKFEIANKFYKLKAKLLGVKKLEYHERNVPYSVVEENYSYEDSASLVYDVFKELDEEFAEIFKGFVENGLIDVSPKKGKTNGAICFHFLKSQPTYILLNHTSKLRDVTTIAHEAGHGINNELIKKKQNSLSFQTPLSTAEVASTFFEDFVFERLMKGADDEKKLSMLIAKLDSDVSTILRQIALYNFETELHASFREKGYLSKEEIGKMFRENMAAYMGDFVEQSDGCENWWVYWSHIRKFFYVYSYASGLLISRYLQGKVRKDKKFVENVKEFLSAGTSKSPKDVFDDLGIDISRKEFWIEGLKETEKLLKEAEDLARKLGKIN